ncbi:MAG: EFR1 family ferrodoxin [Vallitalea sp.]|jgi:ferredoxin/menaquinone-dependent protoporphyrinogen IX oxidase|nr:EFR1 family ferrodoxin [Vallitalea sp.]
MIELEDRKMNVLVAYFSATGNTKKIAKVIESKLKQLNGKVNMFDISSYQSRENNLSLTEYDTIFFGFPIYSMRAPRICREWLQKLDGEGKKCSVFFTYGGFGKDPAHYYMKKLLDKRNFNLISTAEFLGAHTFNRSGWQAAEERPNESDFSVAEEYVAKTIEALNSGYMSKLKFKKPKYKSFMLDQAEKYRFRVITQLPTRNGADCSMCGICEKICPTKAMDANKGFPDPNSCIACFRCIANCPDKVLHTNDISHTFEMKLNHHKITKEGIDKLESKIYI